MNLLPIAIDISNELKRGGWSAVQTFLLLRFSKIRQKRVYKKWVAESERMIKTSRKRMLDESANLVQRPLISILVPVYDVEEKWLRLAIESVRRQLYENWELCIADDCSPRPHVRRVLREYDGRDERIKVVFRKENGHISAASNSALDLATGEFTVLLDHDDELSEDALFYVAKEINEHPDVRMIYSDEDLMDTEGRRFGPKFKPDWSRDLFYSTNLITHLSAYKTDLLKEMGGFNIGLEGSQDYDLALRVIERIDESQIRHIPRVLYHWRVIETSVSAGGDAKPYAHQAARDAIASHMKRAGKKATVTQTVHNLHRVRYELPDPMPSVSMILIADWDIDFALNALEKIASNTDYARLEITAVCQAGKKPEFDDRLEKLALKNSPNTGLVTTVIEADLRSDSELLNFAADQSTGDILCFADFNLSPVNKDWLSELVSFAVQKDIGAAGAKLLYPNGTMLHGGLLIGVGGTVGIAHHGWPAEADGNITRTRLIGNYSAVSVSGMAVRRELFEEIGGFDEHDYRDRLFDADFCLRLRERGLRIVWTPHARLQIIDNKKRINLQKEIDEAESEAFNVAWQSFVERDPYYNPNLSKASGDFFI